MSVDRVTYALEKLVHAVSLEQNVDMMVAIFERNAPEIGQKLIDHLSNKIARKNTVGFFGREILARTQRVHSLLSMFKLFARSDQQQQRHQQLEIRNLLRELGEHAKETDQRFAPI